MAGPVAFVGREGELSRLLEALDGRVRLVLVVGDAGVGKTRFAEEGMVRAAAAGLVMMRGECLPLADTLPLLPVVAALGELGRLYDGRLLEAALHAAPGYVRGEVGRLLPRLGRGSGPGLGGRSGGWRRERLFSALAELLDAVAQESGSGLGLVIEDVHWADSATLDCLTFLARAVRLGGVTVVATCRSDEAPLAAHVAGWLAHARGGGTKEVRLGPLSRAEVAEQVAALAGRPVPPRVVDELYVRAEGNPFFTEQLAAAVLADAPGGGLGAPAGLPVPLAELLAARADRCGGDAGAVLAALAVAGRPLPEDLLSGVSGLDVEVVRRGLRELAAARLLGDDTSGGVHRPRHALLAEAVAAALLPGERAVLHERTARALQASVDDSLAAEAAGHWQAAGRAAEELPTRVAAAEEAERVFVFAQAAVHWERAIELFQTVPSAAHPTSVNLPSLYLRAIGALQVAGDTQRAGILAEDAYRRFASHSDAATAAEICHRAGYLRGIHAPDAGLPLMEEALRLFERAPPSAEHAEALLEYADVFLLIGFGRREDSRAALNQALGIAEAASATAVIPRVLGLLALHAFLGGQVAEGFATLHRARAVAEAAGDSEAPVWLAVHESDALAQVGDLESGAQVALRGLRAARKAGLDAWLPTMQLAALAAEELLCLGRTDKAAALIEPMTTGPPGPDDWLVHHFRAQIDLLRGDIEAATCRLQQITGLRGHFFSGVLGRDAAQRAAEVALWAGRPGDALQQVREGLGRFGFHAPELMLDCGELLATGMRACADLAQQARARRDEEAGRAAHAAASDLAVWADRMAGVPFTDHPWVADIPANRATWEAERSRLIGASDPALWGGVAKAWQGLGWPHRAGYAMWRQAEAQLDAGQAVTAAATALRAASRAADGHAPLVTQIRLLAERARIPIQARPSTGSKDRPRAEMTSPYGLTERELVVLRLLAAGRTNPQIGAELFISRTTARVHVSNILRKLGVTSRVQAAAVAERAALLGPGQR
jgi:DNA-binding CsgD family transcriptional regulator